MCYKTWPKSCVITISQLIPTLGFCPSSEDDLATQLHPSLIADHQVPYGGIPLKLVPRHLREHAMTVHWSGLTIGSCHGAFLSVCRPEDCLCHILERAETITSRPTVGTRVNENGRVWVCRRPRAHAEQPRSSANFGHPRLFQLGLLTSDNHPLPPLHSPRRELP